MAEIIRFPRRKRHARTSSTASSGRSWKSSAVISPFEKSFSLPIVDQSGRTLPRRMRLTVTRETSMAPATSSSDKPRDSMKDARCVMPDLYTERTIEVKAFCTPGVLYRDNDDVHDVYMPVKKAKKARKVISRLKRPRFQPTKIKECREAADLTQDQLAVKVGEYLAERGLAKGYSYSMIGRLERGIVRYTQPVMEAIADALGCDVPTLIVGPRAADPPSFWKHADASDREKLADYAEFLTARKGTAP
jgi:transcriptional regulator with XRE-family HTH domain